MQPSTGGIKQRFGWTSPGNRAKRGSRDWELSGASTITPREKGKNSDTKRKLPHAPSRISGRAPNSTSEYTDGRDQGKGEKRKDWRVPGPGLVKMRWEN